MKRKQDCIEKIETLKTRNPTSFRRDNFVTKTNHKLNVEVILTLIAEILTPKNKDFVSLIHVCKFWYNNRIAFSQKASWSTKGKNIHFLSELNLKPTSLFVVDEMKPIYMAPLVQLNVHTLGLTHIPLFHANLLKSVTSFISLSGGFEILIPPNTERLHTNSYCFSVSKRLKHIIHENITCRSEVVPGVNGLPNLEIYECQNLSALPPNLIDCQKLTSLAIGTNMSTFQLDGFFRLNVDDLKDILYPLVNLERLFIRDLNDLSILSTMKHLKLLQCRFGKFKTLNPLCVLTNLEILEIPDCDTLRSLDGLQHLKQLRYLNIDRLSGCDVSPFLELCSTIVHLSLVRTEGEPPDLRSLTNLKTLRTEFVSDMFATFRPKAPPKTVFYKGAPYSMLSPWAFFDNKQQ